MSQLREQLVKKVLQLSVDYLSCEEVQQAIGLSYQQFLNTRKRGEFLDPDKQEGNRLYWKRIKVEQWVAYRCAVQAAVGFAL